MMFKQIEELLGDIIEVYEHLEKYYKNLENYLNDELSVEIVRYIESKTEIFEEMLKYYKKSGNEEILKTWIQFSPELHHENPVDFKNLNPEMKIDKVNQIVIKNENWLLRFYEYIIQTTSSTRVKELFQTILERQKADLKSLTSSVKILQDI